MQRQGGGVSLFLVMIAVLGGFGFLLWRNAQPTPSLRVILPTEAQPTVEINPWQSILAEGFGSDSTPLPTVAIPTGEFIIPTLPLNPPAEVTPLAPSDLAQNATTAPFAAATPTPPPPTAALLATSIPVTSVYVTRPPSSWQPPPLIPPISRDPLGRDHYWLARPVDSNATNRGLFYYPYGSDGPEDAWRIHAGIDMPNPIGETVRAAGSGMIVWAADGLRVQGGAFQDTYSYGNVVVIRHDFGYQGRPVFTLYAHLNAVLVTPGQTVQMGDAIGLSGNSGRTTGPHVHFEVRLGEVDNLDSIPTYASTYNPVLWVVPYVGTGVIAGRVSDAFGDLVMDVPVTIREWARGLVTDTTTTYIYQDTGVDVNADPVWGENFVVGDIPAGRYEVIADIGGDRVSQLINVIEGTTTFVELTLQQVPTIPAPGS